MRAGVFRWLGSVKPSAPLQNPVRRRAGRLAGTLTFPDSVPREGKPTTVSHSLREGGLCQSLCRYPDLYQRSFVVSSFGKTYHVTGWKVGYCIAPPDLTKEFRRIHQFVTFTVNTPVQYGLGDFLVSNPDHHRTLSQFYQSKRDYFCDMLAGSKFEFTPSAGTYFQLLDYTRISAENDVALARRWTEELGVASIPVSVFYQTASSEQRLVLRFCFAKDDATLERAAEILCSL